MRLDEFYRAAERRARELGAQYWSVEVMLTMTRSGLETEYRCYMPEARSGYQVASNPEGALAKIGAFDPCFEDTTELPTVERSGTG